jgi:CDP-diacylglycerol--glycerol-3-phosphate 3-phosphatidyltransferase
MSKKSSTKPKKGEINLLSIPNLITISRILAIPFLAYCFCITGSLSKLICVILFSYSSLSDFLDGYLARKLHQTSNFGRFLDPVADKLLFISTSFLLVAAGIVSKYNIVFILVSLCREIAIMGLRELLAEKKELVKVFFAAKFKTAIQFASLGFYLFAILQIENKVEEGVINEELTLPFIPTVLIDSNNSVIDSYNNNLTSRHIFRVYSAYLSFLYFPPPYTTSNNNNNNNNNNYSSILSSLYLYPPGDSKFSRISSNISFSLLCASIFLYLSTLLSLYSAYVYFRFPSFLPSLFSILPSFLPFFLSFPPSFLPSFLPSSPPSLLPSFPPSFLPSFFPSFFSFLLLFFFIFFFFLFVFIISFFFILFLFYFRNSIRFLKN